MTLGEGERCFVGSPSICFDAGMRSAITKLILALGRYAVLPIVAGAVGVLVAWLLAIDHFPMSALIASPIGLPIATCAIVLALGLLVLPGRRPADPAVDEQSAPGLWRMWNDLDDASPRSGRTLLIDAALNASISERRRFLGLFQRQLTMTIGLQLLIVLDERAVRAIIAHQVAHARLQHTSVAATLSELIAAAENIFDHADPETTVTGRIADILLHALLEWLQKEYLILSRQNELSADRQAAERVGSDEMARALVLTEAMSARMNEIVFTPLEQELLGAIRAPAPPLRRILSQLDTIRAPDRIEAAARAGLAAEEDANATHPPLRARLANLGFVEIPNIDMAKTSAADSVLSHQAIKDLVARFDGEWRQRGTELVGIDQ